MDDGKARPLYVIVNPSSGNSAPSEVRHVLGQLESEGGPGFVVHETTPGEDVGATARTAAERGAEIVVAAGGDGTASVVADGLVGTSARLGIIPLGTTNVLARELAIPMDLEAACRLLAGPSADSVLDAMRIGATHYFTQIGIGLDALMIRDTTGESKRQFGIFAYLKTAAVHMVGYTSRRFSVSVDGRRERPKAIQILMANCGALGASGLRWGENIKPDDGRIAVCIIKPQNLFNHLSIMWNVLRGRQRQEQSIRYRTASNTVAVHTDPPLPVQADGEIIGETPVEIRVVPRALRVVIPQADGIIATAEPGSRAETRTILGGPVALSSSATGQVVKYP